MKIFCLTMFLLVAAAPLMASPKLIQEAVEAAAKISGKSLTRSSRIAAQKSLGKAFSKYGDDVLRITKTGGLEVIKQGAKYGDDFWRLAKNASPQAVRSLALHADDLMPLAKRLGDDFMRLESKVPGLGAKIVAEFGDDAAKTLARSAPDDISKLLGYAKKADSPATKKLLLEKYRTGGSKFLNSLNWKHVMAGGLSVAMITAAYKISDGIEDGIEEVAQNHPERFIEVVNGWAAPVKWAIFICLLVIMIPVFKLAIWLGQKIKVYTQKKGKSNSSKTDIEVIAPEIVLDDLSKNVK